MTRINTNIESLRGLRNLQKSTASQNTTLERLSTGLKINSGRDNPAGLIASQTLGLQVTTIQQSISNSNRANNVIATADAALGEVGGLLNQIRGLVQEGLNQGALSQDEVEANQTQIDAALSAINRISSNTTFAGDRLLDGSKAFTTSISTTDAGKLSDFKVNEALFGTASSVNISATVTSAAEKAQLRYTGGALSAATNLQVGGSNGQETIFLGASTTLTQVRDAINNVSDSTGVAATITNGFTVKNNAVANSLTTAIAGNNNDLVFTDARRTNSLGTSASLGGTVNVQYAVAGANTPLSVAVNTDANNNKTIVVNVATDANSAATSTAAQVTTAIQQNADAAALVTVANAAGNDGTGTVAALTSTALANGTDFGQVAITDKRTAGAAGNVSISFTAGGAAGVAVTRTGNDSSIAVTYVAGTTTLANVKTLLEANASANSLVDIDASGDTGSFATALTSTTLAASTGTLVLESTNFGSDEYVDVSALTGDFTTYKTDGTTIAKRDNGADIGVTINGSIAQSRGLSATIRSTSIDASLTFNSANNVVNRSATVSVTGGGSLFQIGQEATSAGQIGIGIEAVNTAKLGGITGKIYELGSGAGRSLLDLRKSQAGTGPKVNSSDLVGIIDQALNRVNTLRGRLGAIQKNVIDTNVSTLGVALENITAARSQIVDADFAEETANLQRTQVLTQAGVSVLSIANQNPQQVLSLLR